MTRRNRPARTSPPTSARRSPRSSRGRRVAAVVAIVLVLLLVLFGAIGGLTAVAPPASAHDALTGSTPADGATVDTPPAAVDLTFSQSPLTIGAEVRVTGPDGAEVDEGDLTVTGTTVSQPLASGLPAGAYAVVWRVTSGDGHPISGQLSFTAAGGAVVEPEPSGPAEPSAEPSEEPSDGATASPSPEVTEPPVMSQGGDAADPGAGAAASAGTLPWVLGAVVLAGAAAAVWWAARRRGADGAPV